RPNTHTHTHTHSHKHAQTSLLIVTRPCSIPLSHRQSLFSITPDMASSSSGSSSPSTTFPSSSAALLPLFSDTVVYVKLENQHSHEGDDANDDDDSSSWSSTGTGTGRHRKNHRPPPPHPRRSHATLIVAIVIVAGASIFLLLQTTLLSSSAHRHTAGSSSFSSNSTLRIAILTVAFGNEWYYKPSIANKRAYAAKHGYDLIVLDDPGRDAPPLYAVGGHGKDDQDPKPHPVWAKVSGLRRNVYEYDWILAVDADAYVANMDVRVEDYVQEVEALHLKRNSGGRWLGRRGLSDEDHSAAGSAGFAAANGGEEPVARDGEYDAATSSARFAAPGGADLAAGHAAEAGSLILVARDSDDSQRHDAFADGLSRRGERQYKDVAGPVPAMVFPWPPVAKGVQRVGPDVIMAMDCNGINAGTFLIRGARSARRPAPPAPLPAADANVAASSTTPSASLHSASPAVSSTTSSSSSSSSPPSPATSSPSPSQLSPRDDASSSSSTFPYETRPYTVQLIDFWLAREPMPDVHRNGLMEQEALRKMIEANVLDVQRRVATVPLRMMNSYAPAFSHDCSYDADPYDRHYRPGDWIIHFVFDSKPSMRDELTKMGLL
ncbi:hypothetical protein DFJ73DRAFT_916147, partial [Zopfochytrium polystomum]